jgi:hypothetical protein
VRGDRYCIVVRWRRLSSATFTVGGSVSSDIKWVEIEYVENARLIL